MDRSPLTSRGPGFWTVVVLAVLMVIVFIVMLVGVFTPTPEEAMSPEVPVRFDPNAPAPGR